MDLYLSLVHVSVYGRIVRPRSNKVCKEIYRSLEHIIGDEAKRVMTKIGYDKILVIVLVLNKAFILDIRSNGLVEVLCSLVAYV